MSYTLKVDWPAARIDAVHKVLAWPSLYGGRGLDHVYRMALAEAVEPYTNMAAQAEATIKLDVPLLALDVLECALGNALSAIADRIVDARDNIPGADRDRRAAEQAGEYMAQVYLQTEVFAALRDVQTYREVYET